MQLERNNSLLNEFIGVAVKYQAYDDTYNDLSHADGIFSSVPVEKAYIVFLYLKHAQEESNIKKAFNQWRIFHFGESRRMTTFFKFIEMLNSKEVSSTWENKWDAKDRNIDLERECLCRIFILSGITAQMSFYRSGILQ